jgi:hypothetical protein
MWPTRRYWRLLNAYQESERIGLRGTGSFVQTLPLIVRRELFARMREIASAHGIELSVCGCKNPNLASGACNITGRWSGRPPSDSKQRGVLALDNEWTSLTGSPELICDAQG